MGRKNFAVILTIVVLSLVYFSGCSLPDDGGLFFKKDTKAPAFAVDNTTDEITGRSFVIAGKLNEKGKVYWGVYSEGTESVSFDDLKIGKNAIVFGNKQVSANIYYEIAVSSMFLNPETKYELFIVGQDDAGNKGIVANLSFQTALLDTVAPDITELMSDGVSETGFGFRCDINKKGKIYYIVTDNTSDDMSSDVIISGTSTESINVVKKGSSQAGVLSYSGVITGLIAGTEYRLVVTAENMETPPVTLINPQEISFTTLNAAQQGWTLGSLPKIDNQDISGTIVKAYLAVQKAGKIYGVAVPKGSTTPTSAQIKEGKDGSGNTLGSSLARNYTISSENVNTYNYLTFSTLTPETEYDFYFTADTETTLISPPYKISITTIAADDTPQEWSTGMPPALDDSNTTTTTLRVNMAVKRIGAFYGVLLPKNSNPPSALQVKAGQDASGDLLNSDFRKNYTVSESNLNIYKYISFSNLTPDTEYDIFVTATNEAGTCIDPPVKISAKTAAPSLIAPEWTAGHPKSLNITKTTFEYFVAQQSKGKIYFIVVNAGATAPTTAEVKAGVNYGGVTLVSQGYKTVNTPDYSYKTTFSSGLTAGAGYDVYAVGESDGGTLMASVNKLTVQLLDPDPEFVLSQSKATPNSISVLDLSEDVVFSVKVQALYGATASAVKINLSTIGGSGTQVMYDDGTNGDAVSGDGVYSYEYRVPDTITEGSYTATVTVTGDAPEKTVNIGLTINDGEPPVLVLAFTNSDMESDIGLTTGVTSVSYSTTEKVTGTRSLQVIKTMGGSNGDMIKCSSNLNSKGSYTKISFYVKGTGTKGLVVQIGGSSGNRYFVLGDLSSETISAGGSASYTTGFDTLGQWIKVTLVLDGTIVPSEYPFTIRGGSSGIYNFYIDDIVYE